MTTHEPNLSIPNMKDARKTVRKAVGDIINELLNLPKAGFIKRAINKLINTFNKDILESEPRDLVKSYVIPVEGIYAKDTGAVDALIKLVVNMISSRSVINKRYRFEVTAINNKDKCTGIGINFYIRHERKTHVRPRTTT